MGSGNSKEEPQEGNKRLKLETQGGNTFKQLESNFSYRLVESVPPQVEEGEEMEVTTILWKLGNIKSSANTSDATIWSVLAIKDFEAGNSIGLPSVWRLQLRKYTDNYWFSLYLNCLKAPPGVTSIRAQFSVAIQYSFSPTSSGFGVHEYQVGPPTELNNRALIFGEPIEAISVTENSLELVIPVRIYGRGNNSEGNSPRPEVPKGPLGLTHKLFLNPEAYGADVTFRFPKDGNKERKAHRNILAAGNPVFEAMFNSAMAEANSGIVIIDDIGFDVMEIILECIYTGRVPRGIPALENKVLSQLAKELVYGAEKYGLAELRDFCDRNLIKICCAENAKELLDLAMLHKLTRATVHLCDFIKNIVHLL